MRSLLTQTCDGLPFDEACPWGSDQRGVRNKALETFTDCFCDYRLELSYVFDLSKRVGRRVWRQDLGLVQVLGERRAWMLCRATTLLSSFQTGLNKYYY